MMALAGPTFVQLKGSSTVLAIYSIDLVAVHDEETQRNETQEHNFNIAPSRALAALAASLRTSSPEIQDLLTNDPDVHLTVIIRPRRPLLPLLPSLAAARASIKACGIANSNAAAAASPGQSSALRDRPPLHLCATIVGLGPLEWTIAAQTFACEGCAEEGPAPFVCCGRVLEDPSKRRCSPRRTLFLGDSDNTAADDVADGYVARALEAEVDQELCGAAELVLGARVEVFGTAVLSSTQAGRASMALARTRLLVHGVAPARVPGPAPAPLALVARSTAEGSLNLDLFDALIDRLTTAAAAAAALPEAQVREAGPLSPELLATMLLSASAAGLPPRPAYGPSGAVLGLQREQLHVLCTSSPGSAALPCHEKRLLAALARCLVPAVLESAAGTPLAPDADSDSVRMDWASPLDRTAHVPAVLVVSADTLPAKDAVALAQYLTRSGRMMKDSASPVGPGTVPSTSGGSLDHGSPLPRMSGFLSGRGKGRGAGRARGAGSRGNGPGASRPTINLDAAWTDPRDAANAEWSGLGSTVWMLAAGKPDPKATQRRGGGGGKGRGGGGAVPLAPGGLLPLPLLSPAGFDVALPLDPTGVIMERHIATLCASPIQMAPSSDQGTGAAGLRSRAQLEEAAAARAALQAHLEYARRIAPHPVLSPATEAACNGILTELRAACDARLIKLDHEALLRSVLRLAAAFARLCLRPALALPDLGGALWLLEASLEHRRDMWTSAHLQVGGPGGQTPLDAFARVPLLLHESTTPQELAQVESWAGLMELLGGKLAAAYGSGSASAHVGSGSPDPDGDRESERFMITTPGGGGAGTDMYETEGPEFGHDEIGLDRAPFEFPGPGAWDGRTAAGRGSAAARTVTPDLITPPRQGLGGDSDDE